MEGEGRKPRRASEVGRVESAEAHPRGRGPGWVTERLGEGEGRKESCWEGKQARDALGLLPPVGPSPTQSTLLPLHTDPCQVIDPGTLGCRGLWLPV